MPPSIGRVQMAWNRRDVRRAQRDQRWAERIERWATRTERWAERVGQEVPPLLADALDRAVRWLDARRDPFASLVDRYRAWRATRRIKAALTKRVTPWVLPPADGQ